MFIFQIYTIILFLSQEFGMNYMAYILSFRFVDSDKVPEDLTIEKQSLSMLLCNSSRSEIEQCLATESMNPTRVSTFDVVRCDLQSRHSSYPGACPNKDIRLIDTSRYLAIWIRHLRHSLDRYLCATTGKGEDREG